MKNIIVPIDFSKDSLNGLKLALIFSARRYTNIQMVYVQKRSSDYYIPGRTEEEHKWAERKFRELIKEYGPRLKSESKLRYIIKQGKIFKEIVNQAESYRDAMVVASTHGASGFEEFFIGSNAFKIISATEKPVITIRGGHCPEKFTKIVMPLDVHVDTRQKVPKTAEIAELFGSEIHVITVSSSRSKKILNRLNAYRKQVTQYLSGRGIAHKSKSLYGENIAGLTVVYADSIDADLISVMKDQGKNLSIFMGSYTHQILNRATIPVLTISARETHTSTGFRTFGG